jgi:hypothetical protein
MVGLWHGRHCRGGSDSCLLVGQPAADLVPIL